MRKKLEWLSQEDLLKRVLSLEFNRLLAYYQNMPDIDLNESDKGKKGRKESEPREKKNKDRREAEPGYERLMVNVGKSNGFFPGNLMELVNRNVNGAKPVIGRIDLLPAYTLFDVRKEDAHRVLDALKHAEFFGDKIHAEIASDKDYSSESRKGSKGKKSSRYAEDRGSRKPFKDKKRKEDRDKKESKPKKSKKYGDLDDFALDFASSKLNKGKKDKKEKKEKKEKSSKPKYNGNYDIFMK